MPMTRKMRKLYNTKFQLYYPKKLTVKEVKFFERYLPEGVKTELEEPEPFDPIDTSSYKQLMRTVTDHYKKTFKTGSVRAKNRVNRYVKVKHASEMADNVADITEQIRAVCLTIPDQPLVLGITLHGMLNVNYDEEKDVHQYDAAPVPCEMVYINTASEGVDTLVDDRAYVFRNVYEGKVLQNVYAQMKGLVTSMKEKMKDDMEKDTVPEYLEDKAQARFFLKHGGVKMYRLSKGEDLWQKDLLMRANETGRLFIVTQTGEIDLLPLLTVRRHASHEDAPVWVIRLKTLLSFLAKFKRPLIVADFSCNAFFEGGLRSNFNGSMAMKAKVGNLDKVAEARSSSF